MDEQCSVVWSTREIGIHELKAGIFLTDASLFSPVVIDFESDTNIPHNGFQTLNHTFKGGFNETRMKEALSLWGSYAGVAGVAQYSLSRKSPAFALARFDINFRDPTIEEMSWDVNNFGEQVIGKEYNPSDLKMRGENRLLVWGSEFVYTGPKRFDRFVFNTVVRKGSLPSSHGDLAELLAKIEEESPKDKLIAPQCFQFYHANNGKLVYSSLGLDQKYSPQELRDYGILEFKNQRLIYNLGKGSEPIDFTQERVD